MHLLGGHAHLPVQVNPGFFSLFGLSKPLPKTRKREQQPFIRGSFRIGFNLSRLYSFVLVFQKFCLRLPWKS